MPQHERRRPAPTSALAPSPTPLMPVPDPPRRPREDAEPARGRPAGDRVPEPGGPDRRTGERGGRRQHHRAHLEPDPEPLVFLSGRIPRPLRDELHIRAIHEGRPAVDLLRDALRRYLDDPPGQAP